jgi:predicted small metal-binding protein
MNRKMIDCRDFPNEVGCTLTIAGQEDEVLTAAVQHATTIHGHSEPADELRAALRSALREEAASIAR